MTMPNSATQRLCTPADPTSVLPTEAEIAEAIKSGWFEGLDEFGKYGPQFDPLSAARAVLALLHRSEFRSECRLYFCVSCGVAEPCPTVLLLDQIEADVKGGDHA